MKLYRISGQSRAERREWAGTQADAKRIAKERGGFFDLIEVPTDKDGLIAYLNGMEGIAAEQPALPVVEPPKPSSMVRAPKPEDGSEALIDWIFDHATNSQVCDLFLGLSSRMNTIIKEQRNG
jgi:hypothetical protein